MRALGDKVDAIARKLDEQSRHAAATQHVIALSELEYDGGQDSPDYIDEGSFGEVFKARWARTTPTRCDPRRTSRFSTACSSGGAGT